MPTQQPIRDDWLLPVIQELVPSQAFEAFTHAAHVSQAPHTGTSYWSSAVRAGLVTDEQILNAVARRTRLHVAATLLTSATARDCVPERLARRYAVLPLALSDTTLDVAMGNPYDLECEQTLAFVSGKRIRITLAAPAQIMERIDEVYRPVTSITRFLAGLQPSAHITALHETPAADVLTTLATSALERPIIQLVDHIVAEGITMRASDIHLETEETGVAVRYRVDGVLCQAMALPKGVGIPLVSRVKIMAQLDIADRLRPQGGRARVLVDGAPVDLRVSTLPAAHGEKVVIRILDPRAAATSLDGLGLDPRAAARLRGLLDTREGLILVTGPTGSGKTTTLYATLRQLLGRALNIVTVEDPVEYRVPGIVQVQVNTKAGLTFAEALRSILRQDPDVVLIGEVRDRETATIAIQAALTGHLVFATLHTIDACSSITRLQDLGVEPTKIAAALKGVVAQRLVRRLCPACATPSQQSIPTTLWDDIPTGATLFGAAGCEACGMMGYKGRFAVTEILVMTPALERLIAQSALIPELTAAARRAGTLSLWMGGVTRLLAQETTVDEITRVLEPDYDAHPERQSATDTPASIMASMADMVDAEHVNEYDMEISPARSSLSPSTLMTNVTVGVVDVYIIDPSHTPWRTLALQRAPHTRCPGAWEAVHGHIEPEETPEHAALRELREETGLSAQRLYNVTVHAFYLHQSTTVQLAVVFCAFVDSTAPITLGDEHTSAEWLPISAATERLIWPRATQALREIQQLLKGGDAGPAEDVLRVV